MASPTDLVPERYEVIKLKSGTEVVGMTRDLGETIENEISVEEKYSKKKNQR